MVAPKTLRFDEDVLDIVSKLRWSQDGTIASINMQLPRPLYDRVNKALVGMGGKWKTGIGHVFTADPRPSVDGLLSTGVLQVAREGWFPTSAHIAAQMVGHLDLSTGRPLLLDPSVGEGALVQAALSVNYNIRVHCCELNEQRRQFASARFAKENVYIVGDDFLAYNLQQPGVHGPEPVIYDRILMNPPFENGQDIDHTRHAFRMLKVSGGRLVGIMSEGSFFRDDKKATDFREWFAQVRGYSEKLAPKAFAESGTNVSTRMIVIAK